MFSVFVSFPEYLRYGFRASVAGAPQHSFVLRFVCRHVWSKAEKEDFIILKAWLLREITYICRVLLALEARDGQGAVKRIYIKA